MTLAQKIQAMVAARIANMPQGRNWNNFNSANLQNNNSQESIFEQPEEKPTSFGVSQSEAAKLQICRLAITNNQFLKSRINYGKTDKNRLTRHGLIKFLERLNDRRTNL